MPVTTHPAPHGAYAFSSRVGPATTDTQLLQSSCPREFKACESMIQSSFSNISTAGTPSIYASANGFVRGALAAYNDHHHLVLRPEHVWLAILTQLNLYINKNAEELRHLFVAHEGKKELTVKRLDYDYAAFAETMTYKLEENIVDPSLREWIMPAFTTTTDTDRVVASVVMMGALQEYFSYRFHTLCGLPSVTLLGEKGDWEAILAKLERIPTFGEKPAQWYQLLRPVITRFISTFDAPESDETKDFWQKIAHYAGGGSGPSYLSGWITAFCFWGENGQLLFPAEGIKPEDTLMETTFEQPTPRLNLDGVLYHRIDTGDIPPGCVSVPVKVDDNGHEFDTMMVAGSCGMRVWSSGEMLVKRPVNRWHAQRNGAQEEVKVEMEEAGLDTVQPESGWWIFKKQDVVEEESPWGLLR